MDDLKTRAFSEDVIQIYPAGTKLVHDYSELGENFSGKQTNFEKINEYLKINKHHMEMGYINKVGKEMDTYNLGDGVEEVRENFRGSVLFKKACFELGLKKEHFDKISLPWWIEINAGEFKYELTDNIAKVSLRPMHSFQTQLSRQGIGNPIKSIGIDGLVFAAPDSESENGYITLGVRGGASYPNTYHVVAAGTLSITDKIKTGEQSIQNLWEESELRPELGNLLEKRILSVRPSARIIDHLLNNGNSTYVFSAQTDLTRDEITQLWVENKSPDQKEHNSLFFIPATPEDVNKFILANYYGKVENRNWRKDADRVLLPNAALDLASFSGMNPKELETLYKPGLW